MNNFFKLLQGFWIMLLKDISGFDLQLFEQPIPASKNLNPAEKVKQNQGM